MLPDDAPKNVKQTEDIFHYLVAKGKSRRNPQSIRWWIANYYMRGIRNFSNIDYAEGTVQISYLNEAGALKFQYEEIVSLYQAQVGRLMSLDISPHVKPKIVSLDGVRKASVGQVVLDSAFPPEMIRKLHLNICTPLLLYGTIGVVLWVENQDSLGIDVVMPWEIIPIPVDLSNPTDVRGLMRVRMVPTEWVKGLTITPGEKSKKYKEIDDIKVSVGDLPPDLAGRFSGQVNVASTGGGFFVRDSVIEKNDFGGMAKKEKDKTRMDVTQLTEVWLETPDGYLKEYLVFAGIEKFQLLYRKDHSKSRYLMPIRIMRDIQVGGFWGRSYCDLMIPLNNEIEYGLSSTFQAISDFDLYGFQLWPASLGTPPEAQRGQDGLKRIVYEPDYTTPELKPENIFPAKMTAPQIQAVQLAVGLMGRVANQPSELLKGEAPGRVDSSAGLGFLYEASSIPISPTAKNMADALSHIYRAALRILNDLWTDQKVVSISQLDDSLAGIVLDSETGTMSLSRNAIPFPQEVDVTIKSEAPVSKEQQASELKYALEKGIIDLEEYSFKVRKLGLNLPVGQEVAWQNYRRAMLENILLFGDGKNPGETIVHEQDMHIVHLKVLDAFRARPEFYKASVAVRDKFQKHWDEHQIGLGIIPGMETLDEAAEMALGEGGLPMMGGPGVPQL